MAQGPYRRPPIIEAVIEVRFATAIDERDLAAVSRALGKWYPGEQILSSTQFLFEVPAGVPAAPPTPQVAAGSPAYRRASLDQTEILLAMPGSFAVSQLADYPGWAVFFARFQRDWEERKRVVGYCKITRVGVRYINRLDLAATGPVVSYEDYLCFYAQTPEELGPTVAYGAQAVFQSTAVGGRITVNSGVVTSPIEQHLSIMLDIDVYRENDLPQKDDDLFRLLESFRTEKNRVFEACITDRARELFRQ
jgi:uncharacterized protein (TIGR04255 family)